MAGYVLTGGQLGPPNTVFTWSIAGAGLSDFAQFFIAGTTTFPVAAEQFIRQALQQWATAANINFIEVPDTSEQFGALSRTYPDIRFAYGALDGGDGSGFASFPFASNRGSVWIDSSHGFDPNAFALTVLHEMGHVLGLNHDTTNPAIMNPSPTLGISSLQPDDIAGIQSIYGMQDGAPDIYTLPSNQANLTILNGLQNLIVLGNNLSNTIVGTGFNEVFKGAGGNDIIDGGGGDNSAIFSGMRSAYTLTALNGDSVQVSGPDGLDTLSNIEHLVFNDQTVDSPVRTHWIGSVDVGSHPVGPVVVGTADFNGDGTNDVLWFNASNGDAEVWKTSAGKWAGSVDLGNHPLGYSAAGTGDFNRDGTSDVLWFNPTSGDTEVWKIQDAHWAGSVDIGSHPLGYAVAGVGDFNQDGTSDVLWFNQSNGDTEIWKVQNGQWAGSTDIGRHPLGYTAAGVGDFNGDGSADLLWFDASTGDAEIWKVANSQWAGSVDIGQHPTGWIPAGVADFNHDGTSDVLWYNINTGQTDIWKINNGIWAGSVSVGSHPTGWTPVGIGDLDHNGIPDITWQQSGTGHIEQWLLA